MVNGSQCGSQPLAILQAAQKNVAEFESQRGSQPPVTILQIAPRKQCNTQEPPGRQGTPEQRALQCARRQVHSARGGNGILDDEGPEHKLGYNLASQTDRALDGSDMPREGVSDINARTYVDHGVTKAAPGSDKKAKRSGRFEIIDLGVRDMTPEEMFGTMAERSTKDGISSCGTHWMPVGNADDGNGYDSAVEEYCYHVTHSFDNKPTVIGPGQKHAALVKDGYKLKGGVPAQVDFEIHNKMHQGVHVPDENDCQKYLKMMSNGASKCYGKKNQDTKGGTWQVGNEAISYHGLPGPKTS
ncbi:hypothetical protein F4818DRAFT_438611 [Hypoxylon cercidicola]|nr:hypothetical protein F4818DRAFT_438611 [Hypoxylon cercidicola]